MKFLNTLEAVFAHTAEKSKKSAKSKSAKESQRATSEDALVNTAPADRATPSAPAQAQNRRKKPRIDARNGTRVLIIDDSPAVLTVLRKVFSKAGYVPLVAATAERGLEMAHTAPPDLIMLDVLLPGMNGFAALRNIRRDPAMQHLPVIMMSGNKQTGDQVYVMRIGADGFMVKPFSRFELFSRIENILDDNLVPRHTLKSAIRMKPQSNNHLMN